jgi:hypothetical protein
MMRTIAKAILGAATAVAAIGAAPAAADQAAGLGERASINFVHQGGIADWHAEDERTLYIRDRTGRWYLATLSARCPRLVWANGIRFDAGADGRFDDWDSIQTDMVRCGVETLVRSEAPAAKGGARDRR